MLIIDSKSIADGLCVQEGIVESVGVKTSYLIRVGPYWAYSLESVRVTSSVCLRVRGSRPGVMVR